MKIVIGVMWASLFIGCVSAPGEDPAEGEVEQPTICGLTNDAQHVNSYNGALGPTVAFVQNNKRSKGALETIASADPSVKYCSGSLIGPNRFLTAGHCVSAATVGDFVAFNYELSANQLVLLPQSHFQVTAILEDSLGGVDYAILLLAGNPGATFGIAPVAAADPLVLPPPFLGPAITIIGNPAGDPKQIEAGTIASYSGNYMRYGNVDTLGGSSGSGILNASGQIVGVHTNGGCTAIGGTNSGVRISAIRAVSALL